MPLLELRIRVSADLAGPSPLLDHWKELISMQKVPLLHSLNNSWLTALDLMEIKDVTEV